MLRQATRGVERRGDSQGNRMGGISDEVWEVWVDGRMDVNTCRVGDGKRKGKVKNGKGWRDRSL